MTAAARAGLRLAAAASVWKKISSSGSLFIRRSGTLAGAQADVWKKKGMILGSESKLNKERSLYLSFYEKSLCGGASHWNQVVRRISLNSDDGGKEEYLREATYKRYKQEISESRYSGRFGSQILFPYGRGGTFTRINGIDTSKLPLKFKKFKDFSSPKIEPILWELNGKLYCIDRDPKSLPFEVLDHDEWQPLLKPPLKYKTHVYSSILDGSNKILAWECSGLGDSKGPVFCFDVTEPEKGWTEPCSDLSRALPQIGYRRPPVFIQNHHPELGDFYLVFGYAPYYRPLTVFSFFMSHNCDSFRPIFHQPILLPRRLLDYAPYLEGGDFDICTDVDIVDLGGKKFCLVFNKFFPDNIFFPDDPVKGRDTSIIHILTFEYDVQPDISSFVKIQTKLLGTRRIRYHSRQLRKPDFTRTAFLHVNGAFVL